MTDSTVDPTSTTLLLGGRVHAPLAPDATAMAVVGETVAWVGQDAAAKALYGAADHVVALDGAFVAPAFVDAHVHATSAGLLLDGLDLSGCGSLADCLDAVRRYVRSRPGEVIWGHGWQETVWPERRPPTRKELDAAAEGAPVYLSRIDVHSALVSSALIAMAPQASAADGWSEEGPLARQAHHHVRRAAQHSLTPARRQATQRAFLGYAAAQGIACVHECAGPDISSEDDLADLLALSRAQDLPDVIGYWGELGGVTTARTLGARGAAGDLFIDGALGSRTAALCDPYVDDPTTSGTLYLDADAVAEHLIVCTKAGVQGGFHVIGDAAVAVALEGFAKAERAVGTTALASARHRLEHLEMVTAEQAARLARWGVVASVQPLFDEAWGGTDRTYAQRLGVERGSALNPFGALASAGMLLALGSDAPVTPVNPWAAVRAAVHHRTEGFGLSPRAAFTAHTRGGWRAGGVSDGVTGTLVPGAPATYAVWDADDLVVAAPDTRVQRWSTDPRSGVAPLPPLEPGTPLPRCLRTVLRGQVIYDTEGALG